MCVPDRTVEGVVDGVVFEEVGQRGVVRAGVDHHGKFVAFGHEADEVATDAAKAVDADASH